MASKITRFSSFFVSFLFNTVKFTNYFSCETLLVDWSCDDNLLICVQKSIKSKQTLIRIGNVSADNQIEWKHTMKPGKDLNLIKPHPKDPRFLLSVSCLNHVILWDIIAGAKLSQFSMHSFQDNEPTSLNWACNGKSDIFTITYANGQFALYGKCDPNDYAHTPSEQINSNDYIGLKYENGVLVDPQRTPGVGRLDMSALSTESFSARGDATTSSDARSVRSSMPNKVLIPTLDQSSIM